MPVVGAADRRAVHILVGGNVARFGAVVASGRIRGQNRGTVAESFRVFGRRAVELGAIERRGGNGGNQPFSQGSISAVGSAALEGWGQGAVLTVLWGARRQPSRLRAVPGAVDRHRAQATPPCPHSRARDPLPCCRSRLTGFGLAIRPAALAQSIPADHAGAVRGCAKFEGGTTGRGRVVTLPHAANAGTGRGGRVWSGQFGRSAPGWIGDAKAGGVYVN